MPTECPPNAHRQAPSVPLFNRLNIWLHFYEEALISKCLIAISDVHVYLNNLLKLNSNIHDKPNTVILT